MAFQELQGFFSLEWGKQGWMLVFHRAFYARVVKFQLCGAAWLILSREAVGLTWWFLLHLTEKVISAPFRLRLWVSVLE